MDFRIVFETKGLKEAEKYIGRMPAKIQRLGMQQLSRWGRNMKTMGRVMSPRDPIRQHDSRRRGRKRFASQWVFQVAPWGNYGVELDVGNVDQRKEWILFPTRPRREIVPRGNYPLRFFKAGGEQVHAWYVRGGIASDGTEGQPVHDWIIRAFDWQENLDYYASLIP